MSAGALANYAPRRRTTANVSKRLLSVIKAFREAEAKASGMVEGVEWGAMMQGLDETDPKGRGTTSRKRSVKGDGDDEDDEDGAESLVEVRPVKKRKPRKAAPKSVASTDIGLDDGETEMGTPPPPKKRASRAKGKKKVATPSIATEGSDGDQPEPATDISQVPVEGRKKWRREQQKGWRRAAVANSLKP